MPNLSTGILALSTTSSLLFGSSVSVKQYFVTNLNSGATNEIKLYDMGADSMVDHYNYGRGRYRAPNPAAVSNTAMMFLSTNDADELFFTSVFDRRGDGSRGKLVVSVSNLPDGTTEVVRDDPSENIAGLVDNTYGGKFKWGKRGVDGFSLKLGDVNTGFTFDYQSSRRENMDLTRVMTFQNSTHQNIDMAANMMLRFFSVDSSDMSSEGPLFDAYRCINSTHFERNIDNVLHTWMVPPGTECQCRTESWVMTTPFGTAASQQSCIERDVNVDQCYELNTCDQLNSTQCAEKLSISHAFLTLDQCTQLQEAPLLMPACDHFVCQDASDFSLTCSETLANSEEDLTYCPSGYSTMSECPIVTDMLCATVDDGLTCAANCTELNANTNVRSFYALSRMSGATEVGFVGDVTSESMVEDQQKKERKESSDNSSAFSLLLGIGSVAVTLVAFSF